MPPPAFAESVAPYLHDGEEVVAGGALDGGWVALTSRRCLVYAADDDHMRAVDRADVTGVERTVTAPGASLAHVPRLAVYGLVSAGVGLGARRVAATFSTDLSGAADAPAVGSMLSLIRLFRTGIVVLGRAGLAVGSLLILVAVALAVRWYRSRRPTVVVRTVEGTLDVPGAGGAVRDVVGDLRAALDERPDPGAVLE